MTIWDKNSQELFKKMF